MNSINVIYNNKIKEITAKTGVVPYKICVPIGTRWAKERVNIGIAYPNFEKYCKTGPEVKFWEEETNVSTDDLWDDSSNPSPFVGYYVGQVLRHEVTDNSSNNNEGNNNEGNNNEGNNNEGNNNEGNNNEGNNGEGNNGEGNTTVDEGTYVGYYSGNSTNLISGTMAMNGSAVKIVTDKSDVVAYGAEISVGSKVSITLQVTDRDWWFQVGLDGYGGNGLLTKRSNTSNYTAGDTFTVEVTITQDMYNTIISNVNNVNENWWSGGLFSASGAGCRLIGIYIN